jgi:hypothetical protein
MVESAFGCCKFLNTLKGVAALPGQLAPKIMARHVPVTRELHLPGRRDLLDASTVKDSLNALPGFKTSAGKLHVQAHFPSTYIYF